MGIEINLPAACRAPVYVRGCRTSGRRTSQEVQANHVAGDAGKEDFHNIYVIGAQEAEYCRLLRFPYAQKALI